MNYEQAMEVLAAHLEAVKAVERDEVIDIVPLQVAKGFITVYVSKR